MKNLEIEINTLNQSIENFILQSKKINLEFIVYKEGWRKKDIISHITFWHEYYARVVLALSTGKQPDLFDKSYSEISENGVNSLKEESVQKIYFRLRNANKKLIQNISNVKTLIPYKIGSRSYSPIEYLQTINTHINSHLKDLKRIKIKK